MNSASLCLGYFSPHNAHLKLFSLSANSKLYFTNIHDRQNKIIEYFKQLEYKYKFFFPLSLYV